MLNIKLLIIIFLGLISVFLIYKRFFVFNTEFFTNANANARDGIISTPPNPNTVSSPSPKAQKAEANSVYLASSPGTMPGGAELTQGTTAFLTNTPSRYVQEFATDTIITNSQANAAYRTILNYLSQNPANSAMFLKDIRSKFFQENAKYKEDINFRSLAASDNMIFN